MNQVSQPVNDQNENKNIINTSSVFADFSAPLVASPAQPASQVLPAPDNTSKPAIDTNNGQQFKLASTEVQGSKPSLVSGKGSKFALVVAVSILIIIAGIGGYYLYSKDKNLESGSSPVAVIPTTNPTTDKNTDSDKDGLPDLIEKVLGTYMTKADTDDDGFDDLQEIKSGYSPLIAGGEGKYTDEDWDNVKGKIMIEDREFYEREFGENTVENIKTADKDFSDYDLEFKKNIVGNIVNATGYKVDDFLKQNNLISSVNIDFIKKITNYIKLVDAWGKNYASINIVKDEINESVVYFADNSVIVYSFNLQTNDLKELYKLDPSHYSFELAGRQNSKLLFQKIDSMDSPGACYNKWIYAYENPLPRLEEDKYPNLVDSRTIKELDLNNLSIGFSSFTVPEEKYNSELLWQEACMTMLK